MTMSHSIYKSLLPAALLASAQFSLAQSYTDVYDALPDMTLDQAYSTLLEYQKANPYNANTYLQLGSICEKKMILIDPLRDNSGLKYWADNAELFYGMVKVYYKSGDVRTEFYENLNIPYSGSKLEDQDLWNYIDEHNSLCKTHRDSTLLIYTAIEQSKYFYDKCIDEYNSLCNDYVNMNDLLLRNNDALNERLENLGQYIDKCLAQFDEYKRLTKIYPVMNYVQFYEKKNIETFRLDGLTNSDFYANRFDVWDYRKWIDDYYSVFNADIAPLRKTISSIDEMYRDGREEFEKGDAPKIATQQPYDEFFFFRLGRYDNSSLVRELFTYLEKTRELVVLGGDSIGRNILFAQDLAPRKMRQLYRMTQLNKDITSSRSTLSSAISADKIARFDDFFSRNYGGEQGLRSFVNSDGTFCQSVIDEMANATASYVSDVRAARLEVTDLYSTKSGSVPALPLWVTDEPSALTGKYVTTHVAYDSRAKIALIAGTQKAAAGKWFVAGISDGTTSAWQTQLANVNAVSSIKVINDGYLLNVTKKQKPAILSLDANGKERYSIDSETEVVDFMDCDALSGRIYWLTGNNSQSPALCTTDSLGNKAWTASLSGLREAKNVELISGGYLVLGISTNGELASVKVSDQGTADAAKPVMKDVQDIILTARASASEISLLIKTTNGKHAYVILSQDGSLTE